MYDRSWARSIVENYQKLSTRAQQIDACIQQFYHQETSRNCTRSDIQSVLIDSVQGKIHAKIWTSYKRLVKKSPLDKELLLSVTWSMIKQIDVEKIQRQFTWD